MKTNTLKDILLLGAFAGFAFYISRISFSFCFFFL